MILIYLSAISVLSLLVLPCTLQSKIHTEFPWINSAILNTVTYATRCLLPTFLLQTLL